MESSLIVSLHIQAIDQVAAIKDVKRKITDLDKMKIEEQKKAVRAGYDMDIIPSDLATYGGEAKKLLEDLQSRNERMFLITFLVMNTADNAKQLSLNVKQAQSLAQQHNCQLIPRIIAVNLNANRLRRTRVAQSANGYITQVLGAL